MKISVLLLSTLCYCTTLRSQNATAVTITAGSKVSDVLSLSDILYYPQFTPGKVFLKDGTQAEARLNYNSLFDEMHFIDARGDTLALADEKTVQVIVVQKDTFYYDKGYLRLLAANSAAKLAFKEIWVVSDSRMTGAFGTSAATSAFSSYTSYHAAGSRYGLTVNADVSLRKVQQYYLGNAYNRFVPATKKQLMALFPKWQRQIEQYLKETDIDFSKRADLDKLLLAISGM